MGENPTTAVTATTSVRVRGSEVFWFDPAGRRHVRRLVQLPGPFLRWLLESRRTLYQRLAQSQQAEFAPPHLPVLATLNPPGSPAPVNLSAKGVTLLPREESLAEAVHKIENMCQRKGSSENQPDLRERLGLVASLLGNEDSVNPRVLGGLEIFEGRTFRNLAGDPRAALLFVGGSPTYTSYQIDVVAELVPPSDLRHRYLAGLRRLFEGDRFHVHQTRYGWAYLFWVTGVTDKTPRTRHR